MRKRWLTLIGVVLIALSVPAFDSVRAQSGNGSNGSAPRTPWGHPDLQGIWTTDSEIGVPVERRAEFGNKAVLSEEEFAQRA